MSTRANILVYKEEEFVGQLYHHYDGYFNGVGADLAKFIAAFIDMTSKKPFDPNELIAHICSRDHEFEYEDEYDGPHPHGDIEYLYEVQVFDTSIVVTCDGDDCAYKITFEKRK